MSRIGQARRRADRRGTGASAHAARNAAVRSRAVASAPPAIAAGGGSVSPCGGSGIPAGSGPAARDALSAKRAPREAPSGAAARMPCSRPASACGLTARPRPGSRNAGRSKGRTLRHPRPVGVHCRAAAATAAHLRAPQQPRRCAQAMPHDSVAANGRRPLSGGSVAPPKSVIRSAGRLRACKTAAPRQAGLPA